MHAADISQEDGPWRFRWQIVLLVCLLCPDLCFVGSRMAGRPRPFLRTSTPISPSSTRAPRTRLRSVVGVPPQSYDALFSVAQPGQLQDLNGKRAVVTGASSGIGKATACALAASGCGLVLVARRKEKLEELRAEISRRKPGLEVAIIAGDVNSEETAASLKGAGCFDNLDYLVSNAGLALGRDFVGDASWRDWKTMIETNCYGAFQVVNLLLPGMIRQGSGHVVFLGSIAGLEAYEGGSVYAATKHAVHAFARALRYETFQHNIRCTVVAPGFVGEGTEFSQVRFDGDMEKASAVYANMEELKATDVASQIVWALRQPPNVCLDMIHVMPTCQGGSTRVHRAE